MKTFLITQQMIVLLTGDQFRIISKNTIKQYITFLILIFLKN